MKNTQIISDFYSSFAKLDVDRMLDHYHDEILFEDPAFGTLVGNQAKNMWRMLINSQKGKDFIVSFNNVSADDSCVYAHWEAKYVFSKTGRKVHNKIDAQFKIKDGKIIEHIDKFNLYRWSQQAMGSTGYLIGWTNWFKKEKPSTTNQQNVAEV